MVEYDWGTDAQELLERRRVSGGGIGYDLVICADCVYARSSVEPLLATLCQVMRCRELVADGSVVRMVPVIVSRVHFVWHGGGEESLVLS